jgi:hypothetical protein
MAAFYPDILLLNVRKKFLTSLTNYVKLRHYRMDFLLDYLRVYFKEIINTVLNGRFLS